MRSIKLVGFDSLAPILLLDKKMEEIPEPFRMQDNVLLIVQFSEYLKFIDQYLGKVDYLSTPTYALKQYQLTNAQDKLYAAFLADVAYGIAKELHYAEKYNRPATIIAHSVHDANVKTVAEVEEMYEGVKIYTEEKLYQYMAAKDFELPRFFNKENMMLWHYANVLLFFSMAPGNKWTFSREELISW